MVYGQPIVGGHKFFDGKGDDMSGILVLELWKRQIFDVCENIFAFQN